MNQTTQNGKATTIKETFSRETAVSITINADPAIIWNLLTNASDYPRWNSTIISLDGEIEQGGRITLKSTLDPKRTFKLKVKAVEPQRQLVWGDNKGNRTYTLTPYSTNKVTFNMTEKIGGILFPLYGKYIPPFDESFEQFASDLKREAEAIQNSKN